MKQKYGKIDLMYNIILFFAGAHVLLIPWHNDMLGFFVMAVWVAIRVLLVYLNRLRGAEIQSNEVFRAVSASHARYLALWFFISQDFLVSWPYWLKALCLTICGVIIVASLIDYKKHIMSVKASRYIAL